MVILQLMGIINSINIYNIRITCQYTFGLQYIWKKKITIFLPQSPTYSWTFLRNSYTGKTMYLRYLANRTGNQTFYSEDGFRRIDDKTICNGYIYCCARVCAYSYIIYINQIIVIPSIYFANTMSAVFLTKNNNL